MFKITRKTMVIGCMVILLIITGIINWQLSKPVDQNTNLNENENSTLTGNFFVDFRVERQQSRQQHVQYLDSIIANANTEQETLTEAQQMKMKITDNMEKELTIEGMLKAKGFEDVVVTINDNSVNVVVKDSELNNAKVAQILEVVRRESGQSAGNIKVIPTA